MGEMSYKQQQQEIRKYIHRNIFTLDIYFPDRYKQLGNICQVVSVYILLLNRYKVLMTFEKPDFILSYTGQTSKYIKCSTYMFRRNQLIVGAKQVAFKASTGFILFINHPVDSRNTTKYVFENLNKQSLNIVLVVTTRKQP